MKYIFILLIPVCFTSCYSYKVFPKEYRHFEYSGQKQVAYIINPALKNEAAILKQSGVFIITKDSLAAAQKIKLQPLSREFACGQAGIVSIMTLTQLPVLFPDRYLFRFEEMNATDTTIRQFNLHIAKRIWFWDMFAFNKKFSRKAGKALLGNYFREGRRDSVKR